MRTYRHNTRYIHSDIQTYIQTCRQTDRQTDRYYLRYKLSMYLTCTWYHIKTYTLLYEHLSRFTSLHCILALLLWFPFYLLLLLYIYADGMIEIRELHTIIITHGKRKNSNNKPTIFMDSGFLVDHLMLLRGGGCFFGGWEGGMSIVVVLMCVTSVLI